MCLITTQSIAMIATKDITIYKLVHTMNNGMYTLYRGFLVGLNVTYTSNIDALTHTTKTVVNEALHAYADKDKALRWRETYHKNDPTITLLKGRVPKGSRYYMNCHSKDIAADTMIYDEIL